MIKNSKIELKTLKDFYELKNAYFLTMKEYEEEVKVGGGFLVESEKLRHEAIKWIKHYRIESEKFWKIYKVHKEFRFYGATQAWIKHFFNITEEDLK